ncbi:60S ribosomal protein L7 [Spraguea lophii 42_110]|uniref:60S ribosomal protein L7 n=1 Tax=Spraguea lophii (strain 42_110) TaxID=1358809 RepID=S7W946_SPRLO|nr:Chain LF0, 60S ribosomal protein L7 [Spraguea lophii 42_110]7QJH_KF0 Chain KF0, 60S ribosomal protein L7 [Spraguea lophii 42_110]7QJH_LF0 Chain LF0, 60S ribosomal protein L7 [Spraguea lophii 42_110]8BR3_LF0 Chain LF0, 60S ribosomal protein L7 [Spraguea lophii 42_110]8P5D_LF0 Chain LF0, 60S ribosomal protein L7 [Spraguea lophii 42_110]8P60_KF0 Chain KF0, 60S ribosomal protein L7 [Spraguea lophii 42_110]8P60_LF0 Chain LF0, 60S ribosomal protein L7 [Spraguea lophii 42_110]EPR79455.1 60S ribo
MSNVDLIAKKEQYNLRMEELQKKQQEQHLKRVEENKKYAEKRTVELLETYKKIALEQQLSEERMQKENKIYAPKDPHFYAVVLIKSPLRASNKIKKTLELFRLKHINNCVLVKNNESSRQMLQKIRNFVAYGELKLKTLRELIYKRGSCHIFSEKLNITNETLEDAFKNIRCIEEFIYELYFNDERFKELNNFLNPFKLTPPKGGYKGRKAKDIIEGGAVGNHQDKIGELIKKMI